MKVMKFGGGCLKNGQDFIRVADFLCKKQDQPIAVISAVHGITDMINQTIETAMKDETSIPSLVKAVERKHRQIIKNSISNKEIAGQIREKVRSKIKKMERLLYGIVYTEEITDSIEALILSYGERLCAHVLAGVIQSKNQEAMALESDEIGLITDDSFGNSTAIFPAVTRNIERTILPLIKKGIVPVITGYFGISKQGKVTTFGRNGTDYSSAVIARGIGAKTLEIWKDVNGFMSADPSIVQNAQMIESLSFYEAAELSYFGAKILHPRTVEPLIDGSISVWIKNVDDPYNQGTRLLPKSRERKDVVKSVTYNQNISVLKIKGPGVGYQPGIIALIGQNLGDKGINIYSVLTSQTCINLILDRNDAAISFASLRKLKGGVIEKVEKEENIALVSVVGNGIQTRRGIAARVFSAVAAENINVEMISSGASEVAYYFIVKKGDVEKAVNTIHREFFEF